MFTENDKLDIFARQAMGGLLNAGASALGLATSNEKVAETKGADTVIRQEKEAWNPKQIGLLIVGILVVVFALRYTFKK